MSNSAALQGDRKNYFLLTLVFVCWQAFLALGGPQTSLAQVTQSGLGTSVTPNASVFEIRGGTRSADNLNLFHSFGEFSLGTVESAKFFNDPVAPTTSNIVGRVTGGLPSNILGTVDSATEFPGANLWLINPAGIMFGAGATLNVGGSAHFSAADYLLLRDDLGTVRTFSASTQAGDLMTWSFTSAPVAAFGFLGPTFNPISVQGSTLSVPTGETLSLVGGNVTLTGGTLSAPSGQIKLASVASPGELLASNLQPNPELPVSTFGTLTLSQGTTVDVSGAPGGTVRIRGGQFFLDGSFVRNTNSAGTAAGEITIDADTANITGGGQIISASEGSGSGAPITINVTDTLSISGFDNSGASSGVTIEGVAHSGVFSIASSSGAGGEITATAATVALDNGGTMATQTTGMGPGGNLSIVSTVTPGTVSLTSGATVRTTVEGAGQGGNVTVAATGDVEMAGGSFDLFLPFSDSLLNLPSGVLSLTAPTSTGNAGQIQVSGSEVRLTDGGTIWSRHLGGGTGGTIMVSAEEAIRVSGGNLDIFATSGILSETQAGGNGGNIVLSAPSITVENAGQIGSGTSGTGKGGDIDISASRELLVSTFSPDFGLAGAISTTSTGNPGGEGGTINIHNIHSPTGNVPTVNVSDAGSIATSSSSGRPAGNIFLHADNLRLLNGGVISTRSSGGGSASSGFIMIDVAEVASLSGLVDELGAVFRSRIANSATRNNGNGGIDIHAGTLVLADQAEIFSESEALEGGTIKIAADRLIEMSSGSQVRNLFGSFESGSITMTAPSITLEEALVSGQTNINRDAGAITLNATAGNLTLTNNSHISTNTQQGSGNAGPIVATASDSIIMSGGSTMESSSSSGASGDGGSVTVVAGNQINLSVSGTGLFSITASTGDGGPITVTGKQVQLTDHATISARSTSTASNAGNAGDIFINAGNTFLMENSSVTTQAANAGGGNITVNAGDMVRLINSQINTSVAGGTGGGGNITIDPNFVILQNSQILANAFAGPGGNITITTGVFLPDANSIVDASSQFGLSGTVTIQSPTSNLSAVWARLQQNYVEAAALLRARCAAQVSGQYSSFVQTGRDAIPLEPGGWLLSPLALEGTSVTSPVARELTAPDLTLVQVGLRGFDQNLSWPGLGKMPRRFISILDSACGS